MEKLTIKMIYLGYKGIGLDGFNIKSLNSLKAIFARLPKENFSNIEKEYNALDEMSLEEISDLTKKFCDDYLTINDIMTLDMKTANDNLEYLSKSDSGEELYSRVNSLLTSISPFDLDIKLVNGGAMCGNVHKPIIVSPTELSNNNRKVYFDYIELGRKLNLLSVPVYCHEISHTQTEQNIGYAEDYLNKEVVSIFLEKVAALKLDKSGKLLKLCERFRISNLVCLYTDLLYSSGSFSEEERIKNLMYVKSTLLANKLFDMYMSERKEKNRDKYIDDINAIIEGKITVEEMINKRHISIAQCQDQGLILRHI